MQNYVSLHKFIPVVRILRSEGTGTRIGVANMRSMTEF